LGHRNVDRAYATGELPLGEAIREHIWGEVLHVALPYGAVRSALVIDTGTYCRPLEPDAPGSKTPRGLLVRQCALRPAHFMRAPYFQKAPGLDIPHDRIRVEDAIACLPQLLPVDKQREDGAARREAGLEGILYGLAEFSARLARQHATARARRFMHGAITPSNLCLHGRWLDYDSVSRLPIFASSRHFNPPFWRDDIAIYQTLDAFWFYIGKYTDGAEAIRAHSLAELFHRDFASELRRSFVEVSGIPQGLVDTLPPEGKRYAFELADVLIQMARTDAMNPLPFEAEDLAGRATYDLFRIVAALAATSPHAADAELAADIPDAALRRRLISSHAAASEACAKHTLTLGWPAGSFAKVVFLNTMKAARRIPLLEGASLMKRINSDVVPATEDRHVHGAAHALLDTILHDLRIALPDPVPEKATMVWAERRSVHFDGRLDAWITIKDDKVHTTTAWHLPPGELGENHANFASAVDRFQASAGQA
jgi:hypothetical protein